MSGDRQRGRQAYHGLLFASKQWGTTIKPTNYTTSAEFPLSYTNQPYIALGIGILDADDNNAKTVANVYTATTKTTVVFRTQNAESPSIRWAAIGR